MPPHPHTFRRAGALLFASFLALAACEEAPPPAPAPVAAPPPPPPPPAPEPPPPPPVAAPAPAAPSAESETLRRYYARLQADLLAQGLLRGDGGGADAPFTDAMLARDFLAIALRDEHAAAGGTLVRDGRAAPLRRWNVPIRLEMEFGASVPPEQAAEDRAGVLAFAARLSRLTGVPMEPVEEGGNFHVAVLSEDDREGFGPKLRDLIPGIEPASVRAFLNLPPSTYCLVIALSGGEAGGTNQAVVLIRAELPDLLRTACIHEEMAQGMGLPNDSAAARPSIFNDNNEFGLLTRHDELLLRMLYDPRLRTGMTEAEAAPVARAIAAELLDGGPS